ncbi:hypothetical protein ZIOFF_027232 [Zingiber officinale]|uniref:MLLE-like domain-containing protein n=1 Tax=Zingiber officinale TaxID=94328 RepID=A0A8J5GXG8_ZINOF|nr:hypothetical protein ZIOFF_027232 [Zingiber officinale]
MNWVFRLTQDPDTACISELRMDRRTFGILCDMGSAHDNRVLRDAMIRSTSLKVPQGCYYLVDAGYCNADGFLAPFRGQRFDPQELEPLEEDDMEDEHFEDDEYVTSITPTEEWTNFRNTLALDMFNHWSERSCLFSKRNYSQRGKRNVGFQIFIFELVYERDRAIGSVAQGYIDVIYNLEVDQNDESGGENLGAFYPFSNEYEEDNNVYFESESISTASQNTDVTKSATKRKQPLTTRDKVAKKKKPTAHLDIATQLQDMNNGFHTFVDGFNANFATIANVMAEEILREKMASERMKDVITELMNLSLPSGDVFKAANIFIADKDKIDVLFNLPSELRRNYVVSLLIPSPNM